MKIGVEYLEEFGLTFHKIPSNHDWFFDHFINNSTGRFYDCDLKNFLKVAKSHEEPIELVYLDKDIT